MISRQSKAFHHCWTTGCLLNVLLANHQLILEVVYFQAEL